MRLPSLLRRAFIVGMIDATDTPPLDRAKAILGGNTGIAARLGITSQAVSQWQRVPVERVLDMERATGIPRHELRPDIYPPMQDAG